MYIKTAKSKWCPFSMEVLDDGESAGNRAFDGSTMQAKCVGSECMAWRWQPSPEGHVPSSTQGYCGLAGKP